VISVDSVAGHVAAAVGTPSVTIWTSSSSPHHWRPLASASVVVDPDWTGPTPAPNHSAIS
jgi:ADP-heptose:LPS heptosyltransferase